VLEPGAEPMKRGDIVSTGPTDADEVMFR
jgi:hypothetical protein